MGLADVASGFSRTVPVGFAGAPGNPEGLPPPFKNSSNVFGNAGANGFASLRDTSSSTSIVGRVS